MLPFFLPGNWKIDGLLRVLIGVVLCAAAYMAEVVRGGLQAIPRGQFEAAMALGLGYWRMNGLVILPQALRLVIPGVVNSFISLVQGHQPGADRVDLRSARATARRLCRSELGDAGDPLHRVRFAGMIYFSRKLRDVSLCPVHGAALEQGRGAVKEAGYGRGRPDRGPASAGSPRRARASHQR